MNRYRVARALGPEKYEEVVKEDKELLQLYGLQLMHVNCGLTAALEKELDGQRIHPWNVIEFNEKAWKWIRPLLLRLRQAERALDQETP
ncbi:MAG: hypothetical protein V3W44_00660 [Dehalococcoidales bacterium]